MDEHVDPRRNREDGERLSREARVARRSARRNGRILIITALAALLFFLMSRLGG